METSPRQQATQERIEALIGLAAPVLDLVLRTGDRVARLIDGDDDYYPIRSPDESFELSRSESPVGVAAEPERGAGADDA